VTLPGIGEIFLTGTNSRKENCHAIWNSQSLFPVFQGPAQIFDDLKNKAQWAEAHGFTWFGCDGPHASRFAPGGQAMIPLWKAGHAGCPGSGYGKNPPGNAGHLGFLPQPGLAGQK